MKTYNAISLALVLILMMNGCGLSLDVRKRVHRPGFYVNLSHEKENVKVNGQKEKKTQNRAMDQGNSVGLQNIKQSSYQDFEIETRQPSIEKAPLVSVTDSNFPVAQMSKKGRGQGVSKMEGRSPPISGEFWENMNYFQMEAQQNHALSKGVSNGSLPFDFGKLLKIVVLIAMIIWLSYFGFVFIIALMFSANLTTEILVVFVLTFLFLLLLYLIL